MTQPIRIELPLNNTFPTVNCFLMPGDKLRLIDAGQLMGDNWAIFNKKLSTAGYKASDINEIIITHEHIDHIGLIPNILAISKAVVIAPSSTSLFLTQPKIEGEKNMLFMTALFKTMGFPPAEEEMIINFLWGLRHQEPEIAPSRIKYFNAGDKLNIGESSWEVIHAPGHCPTQYCFIQKEQGRIFSGDMLLPLVPMPIPIEDQNLPGHRIKSLCQQLDSFAQLSTFDIQTVYPGHGPAFGNASQVIENQLARIEMRKNESYQLIKSGISTVYEIAKKLYQTNNVIQNFGGLFMTLGYIDLLLDEGKIIEEKKGNTSYYFSTNTV